MFKFSPTLAIDGYKTSHMPQYPKNTSMVYTNGTMRSDKHMKDADGDGGVVFGIQFLAKYLHDIFQEGFFSIEKEDAIKDFKRIMDAYLGKDAVPTAHIEALHALGYLPIVIKSLPEGTMCPIGVPMFTIRNEGAEFFWLTNYLETISSSLTWQCFTSATIARLYKKKMLHYADKTGASKEFVPFQGHDFSFRGMGLSTALSSAGAHLTSFVGTDTVPAIPWLEYYYGADCEKELVGCSVPATEHSVMCMGGKEDELGTFKRLITELYPTGIISIVSDTWDFWKVVTEYLPDLENEILDRDGKVVIRPDSGDPVDIICGMPVKVLADAPVEYDEWRLWVKEDLHDILSEETPHGEMGGNITGYYRYGDAIYLCNYDPDWNRYDKQYYFIDEYGDQMTEELVTLTAEQKGLIECLWDTFGGSVNEAGYKVLNPHIGAIYGDSITLERCENILKRLESKGFASSNIVFGIGSYTYQYNTRDTLGFAMKATYGIVNGEGREIFKDPATDTDKTKKSARGLLRVDKDDSGTYVLKDRCTPEEEEGGFLETIYAEGKFVKTVTLSEIRERIDASIK